jgi:hypothetical protein
MSSGGVTLSLMRMLLMPMQMERIPQVDACEHGEDVRLDKRNSDFQSVHRDRERKRQPSDQ